MLTMACVSAFVAIAAADIVWRGRQDADLRRRWRGRTRQPWRLS